jgi:crotonobetainyl-CoA:carnitine CoA-transferase CaiB-like acyl-CoA transferase
MDYPGAFGPVPISMSAVRMSETPSRLRLRPPTIGEHTDRIMVEMGFSRREIDAYRDKRII